MGMASPLLPLLWSLQQPAAEPVVAVPVLRWADVEPRRPLTVAVFAAERSPGVPDLGTAPSHWAMHNCDTVLILGSTMPWIDSYPTPGQARGVQVDINPDRIGLRYPTEIGLVGDVGSTLRAKKTAIKMAPAVAMVVMAWLRPVHVHV
jgi:hypothetical protein